MAGIWIDDLPILAVSQNRKPLSFESLEERFDELLDAVLSSRRTAKEPALALSSCSRAQQDFALHWLEVIIRTNSEMGFQFVKHASRALELMDLAHVEGWVIHAMDMYDRQGLYPGSKAFAAVDDFARDTGLRPVTVHLDEAAGVLNHYIHGLAGRALRIENGDDVFTDTEVLFLPPMLNRYSDKQDNFSLYKLTATYLWAQTRFGTFRRRKATDEPLSVRLHHFADQARALALFFALEDIRLEACIKRELPGLGRQIDVFSAGLGDVKRDATWARLVEVLGQEDASVDTTLEQLEVLYASEIVIPEPRPWQGSLRLELAEQVLAARLRQERQELKVRLAEILNEDENSLDADMHKIELQTLDNSEGTTELMLEIDGNPVTPPPDVRRILESLLLDLEEIPPDFLVAAGAGDYDPRAQEDRSAHDVWKGAYQEEGTLYYDEWDFRRRHYRKGWCVLREIDMRSLDKPFVEQTLEKYHGLVSELRRSFEALRGVECRLKRQTHGDDIDLDAAIEARIQALSGREMPDNLFSRPHRLERDIAVIFMVDVSGSTKGWINEAERESLVLLCEALEVLGDRYAIYGFSGMTRKRCELYRIKRIDEPYSHDVKSRIAGIQPQDYTRMGVTIRHLTRLFRDIDARTRLLITLSDGKPDDYDGYRGEYGIEDTRQALLEAKRAGIYPFCITIDHEARDYLPHMYGEVNYTLVDDVRHLPVKVSEIYRRLTT